MNNGRLSKFTQTPTKIAKRRRSRRALLHVFFVVIAVFALIVRNAVAVSLFDQTLAGLFGR